MANAPIDLLVALDQNVISQLREIIRSNDFDHLTDGQKKTLFVAALSAGYKTNLELFLDLKNHPEKIGLPAITEDEFTKTTLNQEVVAANLAKYLEDKEILDSQVEQKFKNRTEKDRALIKRLIEIAALRRQTEILIANANSTTRDSIDNLHHEADPQNRNLAQINQTSQEVVRRALEQSSLALTRTEELAAVALITTAALAGIANLSDPNSLNEIVQAAIPKLNTPVSQIYQEIEANLILTPIPRYDDTNHPQIFPNISLDIAQISLPTVSIESSAVVTLSAPEIDRAEIITTIAKKYSEAVLLNESTDPVMAALCGNFTSDQETELSAALIADNLVSRIAPTVNGTRAATVIDKLSPVNPFVTGAVVRLASQGLQNGTLQQKITSNPNSKTAQFFQKNPRLLIHTITGLNKLEDTAHFDLGKEIRTPAPGGFGHGIQSFTNRVSGLLPGKAGQIFNAAAHPIQFVQGKIGNFIGNQVVGKFKSWLAEKVGAKIANESLKQAAKFVLEKGLQKGLEKVASFAIAKLGGTAVVAGISAALGISTGGVSLVIQAAVMATLWVGKKAFEFVKNIADGIAVMMTGEKLDKKAVLAAPLIALTGIGGVLGSLGAATSAAAMSAGVALIISTIVGFFLYITIITVAPIITTIAHLESGISDTSRVGVIGETPPALLPPGPLPDSCPQGRPQNGYGITQGPSTGTHTSGWGINIAGVAFVSQGQAIDYGTPMNTPVSATHDGQAYYYQDGDNQPAGYGNYVAIIGSCLGNRFLTTYAHLNAGNIKRGGPTSVKKGDLVGLTDNSGHSTGPHLHYEIFGLGDINRYVGP